MFRNDSLSFMIAVIGHLVSLWLIFNGVAVQRRERQIVEGNLEKSDSHPGVKSR
jgi:hypothetical protein